MVCRHTVYNGATVMQAHSLGVTVQNPRRYSHLGAIGILPLLLLGVISSSCTDFGVSPSVQVPTRPNAPNGKFVVNSYSVVCSVATYPGKDSVWTHVRYALAYHFEGSLGTVSMIESRAGGMGITTFVYWMGPCASDTVYRFSFNYWVKDSFDGQDSLSTEIRVKGEFWSEKDGDRRLFTTFERGTARLCPLLRHEGHLARFSGACTMKHITPVLVRPVPANQHRLTAASTTLVHCERLRYGGVMPEKKNSLHPVARADLVSSW